MDVFLRWPLPVAIPFYSAARSYAFGICVVAGLFSNLDLAAARDLTMSEVRHLIHQQSMRRILQSYGIAYDVRRPMVRSHRRCR